MDPKQIWKRMLCLIAFLGVTVFFGLNMHDKILPAVGGGAAMGVFLSPAGRNEPSSSLEDLHDELIKRRQLAMSFCKATDKVLTKGYNMRSLASKEHNFFYCPVEKTASTFWRRFFYQLVYTNPMKSPFDVQTHEAMFDFFPRHMLKTSGANVNDIMKSSYTKLIFVRDPFSRLYSAFVDKLIAPNPYFWGHWGRPSAATYGRSRQASRCGDDVTFAEYISFVVNIAWAHDVHLCPIERLCTPCFFNFTVIGKMETFQRDADEVLRLLGIPKSQVGFERMQEDATADAIKYQTVDPLGGDWLPKSLKCVSKDVVARRILRNLQIRGVVSWRYNYNLTSEQVKNLDASTYMDILTKARNMYLNATELKIQKKQGFLEAYKTVTQDHVKKIQKLYAMDFKMYEYDNYPKYVTTKFQRSVKNTHAFDWRKPWDLTPVL